MPHSWKPCYQMVAVLGTNEKKIKKYIQLPITSENTGFAQVNFTCNSVKNILLLGHNRAKNPFNPLNCIFLVNWANSVCQMNTPERFPLEINVLELHRPKQAQRALTDRGKVLRCKCDPLLQRPQSWGERAVFKFWNTPANSHIWLADLFSSLFEESKIPTMNDAVNFGQNLWTSN